MRLCLFFHLPPILVILSLVTVSFSVLLQILDYLAEQPASVGRG